ncbi:RdgB/HAM1 family non-canonical purine NTP pyrophosphatase, partial [Pelagibacteraceae bacterium]|nr:RdgB/HAM1 family non-canonical purine NTP pyrophosphatase [Pelagibacteraceae bacterium]
NIENVEVDNDSQENTDTEETSEDENTEEDNLEKEIETLKEEKIRLLAEMENLRKRFEREKVETIKFGSINLARDILSPGDNLERALDALPEESGQTFEENAKIKSDYGFNKTGIPCFADDSGICIEGLNWKPGVLSKRFLNNFKSNEACFKSIIQSSKNNNKRNAYFKTSISLTVKDNQNLIFNGIIEGKISERAKGKFGFGYDPVFIPKNYNKTLAEFRTKEKNEISHRSIAVTKLINFLIN